MIDANLPALLALLPAMLGPLPAEQGSQALMLAICGGDGLAITVPLDDGVVPMPATTPCCAKGCRTSSRRRIGNRDN
jgi:hypothetical protein